jgi:hypothetical protein
MSIKRAVGAVPTLDQDEMMCRMIEAATGEDRPRDMSAMYAIQRMLDEQTRQFFERAAQAVTLYLMERTEAVVVTGGETFALH